MAATKTAQQSQTQSRAREEGGQMSQQGEFSPTTDLVEYCKEYARQKPEMFALWCFGVGFVLGWKLKPW
jgi:hypothetical protein